MRRREFITLLGNAAATWPLAALAQQPRRADLQGGLPHARFSGAITPRWLECWIEGLQELGYRVGENVVIEYRFADGEMEQLPALAADLVRIGVDIILAYVQSDYGCGYEGDHDHPDCHDQQY